MVDVECPKYSTYPTCLGDFEDVLGSVLWPYVSFLAYCLQVAFRRKLKKIEAKMELQWRR